MYKKVLDEVKSNQGKKSISNFDHENQVSRTKENDNFKSIMTTMNFWGRGAHCDELKFFQFSDL